VLMPRVERRREKTLNDCAFAGDTAEAVDAR
jgi:hypothetical protein